ncbi:MAG: hypothetical protein IJW92_08035 [Clostridia bacterium]|nr:hypothetical protein [Clostridia bacterium]
MRKLLSMLLVLSLLAVSCLTFASCGLFNKVNENDVKDNPQAVINDAMQNTSNQFFTDDANMNTIVNDALKGGSVAILFESDTLLQDVGITKIGATVYGAMNTEKSVIDASVTMGGEELAARLYASLTEDEMLALLESESILGSDKVIGINFKTFFDNLEGSAMAELFGLEGEAMEAFTAMCEPLVTVLDEIYEKTDLERKNETEDFANELYALLNQSVASAKVKDANGKEVDCVEITYTLNNTTIKAVANKLIDKLETEMESLGLDAILESSGTDMAEMVAQLEDSLDQLDEYTNIDLTLKLNISKSSYTVLSAVVNGSVTAYGAGEYNEETDESEDLVMNINASLTFSETEIKLAITSSDDTNTANLELTLTKEEKDNVVTYGLSVNESYNDEEDTDNNYNHNVINASYSYNKKDGSFVISADVMEDENTRSEFSITGSIAVTNDSAKIELNSVTYDDVTVTFKASITFTKNVEVPAAPTEYLDVVEMTQGEWVDVINEIQGSKLGQLIGGGMMYD